MCISNIFKNNFGIFMRFTWLLLFSIGLFQINLQATTNIEAKLKAKEKLATFKDYDFQKLQAPKLIPEDKKHLYTEIYNKIVEQNKYNPKLQSITIDMDSLPSNFRTPGEFEESQAVLISWPSYAFDKDTNFVEPYTPGVGIKWFQDAQGNWDYEIVDIEGYVLDLESDSPYSKLWATLVNTIQQEVPAWIRVAAPEDTTDLKLFMNSQGYNLTNYVFKVDEDGENAFWMRDFGPFGVYYGDSDSLFFVKAEYYPGRPIDDMYPVKLAQELGYKYYKSPVELEGGNFMCDGHGTGIFGNVIYGNNSDNVGTANSPKKPMGASAVNTEMSRIFNLKQSIIPISLKCDGGTGHIDIYSKMANDEEILVTKYPSEYNKFTFPDYATVNNNKDLLISQKNKYGKQFRFLEVPLPTDDDGKYNRTSCNSFGEDARGYINGLTVNKTFIVPIYSNNSSGNKAGDDAALEVIRKQMPGYKVVGIDSRILTPAGGAIHCVTMQIPAENPVYIQHSQLKGVQIESEIVKDGKIKIFGTVRNHSGFKSGKLFYRCISSNIWTEANVDITAQVGASKSDFDFTSYIDNTNLQCGYGTDIQYYIKFETNNGKTAYRPLTGPEGFYTFNLGNPASIDEMLLNGFELYPNPADDMIYIRFDELNLNAQLEIFDIVGNKLNSMNVNTSDGIATLDVTNYNPGMYMLKITSGSKVRIMKFVVSK
jgi:agmatine/peptidylarginine deiminase